MVCFPAQVVPFRRAVQSAGTPSECFRAVCVCWLWITNLSTWSRCSKGCWETTATCRSTCAELLTGLSQEELSELGSTCTFSHVRMFCMLHVFCGSMWFLLGIWGFRKTNSNRKLAYCLFVFHFWFVPHVWKSHNHYNLLSIQGLSTCLLNKIHGWKILFH